MFELIDKSFRHAIAVGKSAGSLKSGQLFLETEGKRFSLRDPRGVANTDPGESSLALLLFYQEKKLLCHAIGQLHLLFLLDTCKHLLVFAFHVFRVFHEKRGKLTC